MHELSIVLSIVESVEKELIKQNAHVVKRIELDIGKLSGIEWDSFEFAWDPAIKNTSLEGTERIVNHIPAIANCADCTNEFEKEYAYDACPKCGSYLHNLISGKELKIKSLLIN